MRHLYIPALSKRWSTHRVAGTYYHRDSLGAVYKEIQKRWNANKHVGVSVYLERDPTNRYDSNAVRVLEMDTHAHIGWIPKEENGSIAKVMDVMQLTFSGFITEHSNFDTNNLQIDIYVNVPETMKHLLPKPEAVKPAVVQPAPQIVITSVLKTSAFNDYELDL